MNWVKLLANPFVEADCVKDCHDTFGKNNKPKYLKKCVAGCRGVMMGKGLADVPENNPVPKQHVREMPLPVFEGTMAAFNDPDFGTFDEVVTGALSDSKIFDKLQATIRRRTKLKVQVYGGADELIVKLGSEERRYKLARPTSGSLLGLFRR